MRILLIATTGFIAAARVLQLIRPGVHAPRDQARPTCAGDAALPTHLLEEPT